MAVQATKLPNVHPGEVLLEEFLKPMGLSQNDLEQAEAVIGDQVKAIRPIAA